MSAYDQMRNFDFSKYDEKIFVYEYNKQQPKDILLEIINGKELKI